MKVSEEAKRLAAESVRDVGADLELFSVLPDLRLSDAPLADSATESFESNWAGRVSSHLALISATATAVNIVADSLIATDVAMAEELGG